jgi:hypothetical protein
VRFVRFVVQAEGVHRRRNREKAACRWPGVRQPVGPALLALALAAVLAGCASPADGPGEGVAPVPAAESGVERGRLTAAEASASHGLGVTLDGHSRLAVTLVLLSNLPEDSLELNVTGPSTKGQEVDTAPFLYVYAGANPTLSFDGPAVGAWEAHVRLASGAAADYEVHWCADDADAAGPSDNLACHRTYS